LDVEAYDTYDNYAAHTRDTPVSDLRAKNIVGYSLLESSTCFCQQECDTVFNQGNKAALKQKNSLNMVQAVEHWKANNEDDDRIMGLAADGAKDWVASTKIATLL
jgi:hypothetical protein